MIGAREHLRRQREWHPEFGDLGKPEPARHHPNHCARSIAEHDLLAQHVWIAAEVSLPQVVTENDDGVVLGTVFVRCERAAELRRDPKYLEQTLRNTCAAKLHRFTGAAQTQPAGAKMDRDVFEDRVLFSPVEKVWI